MRLRFMAAAAALAAASIPVGAAELSVTPLYQAPPAVPFRYDWGGFYVGGHVGAAIDHRDASIYGPTSALLATGSTSATGLTGGMQIGFNRALSRSWLIGVEADLSAADLNSTAVGATGFGQRDNKIDAFGTLRGRLGYGIDNWLLYATAGVAFAHETLTRTQQIGTINLATPGTVESATNIGSGWAAGAGIEWGITPNWSVRLDYLHLGIGSQSFSFPLAMQRIDASANIDVVRAGVNYRFDGDPRTH